MQPPFSAQQLAGRFLPYIPALVFASVVIYVTAYQPYRNGPPIRSDGAGYHVWTYALKTLDFRFCEYAAIGDAQPSEVPGRCIVQYPPGVALFRFPVMAWFVDVQQHVAFSAAEHWVSLIFGAALTLAIYGLGVSTLRRGGLGTVEAQAVMVLLFFGTGLFHYGTYDSTFSHIYSAFGSALLAWQAFRLRTHGTQMRTWDPWITTFAAFFMILFRNTNVFLLLFFIAVVATAPAGWRSGWRILAAVCVGSAVAIALQLTYNRYASGHLSLNSYPHGSFVWDRPMMASVLFSYERGVITYYPILLFAVALGLARRASRVYASGVAVLLLFYAALYGYWHDWHLGGGFGHRGFVEIVPWVVPAIGLALTSITNQNTRRWVLASMSLTLLVSLPVMFGYWSKSFPFHGADGSVYWAHVLGRLSGVPVMLAAGIGLFAVTEKLTAWRSRTGVRLAPPNPQRDPRWLIAPLAIFAGATTLRAWGVSDHFWMLGDQIRDWGVVLAPLQELPLVGSPTHVGGFTIGPAFYWLYWMIRVTFGPWFQNLPHAGGIGQAVLQSAVDVLLLMAVWKRTGSMWLALAAVLLVVTAPFDLALGPIVWNPVAGSILAKTATALVLLNWHAGSLYRVAVVAGIAWSAVHAYTGAIYVALSIFAALLVDDNAWPSWRVAWRRGLVVVAVVAALQVPYVAYQFLNRFDSPALAAVTDSITAVAGGRGSLRLATSGTYYAYALTWIQGTPWPDAVTVLLLVICGALVAIRYRRQPTLLAVILLPQIVAVLGYAVWTGDLDMYYYLSLMPAAVLTILLGATAFLSARLVRAVSIVLVIGLLAAAPGRVAASTTLFRMPEYAKLVAGSREIARQNLPMRSITTAFALAPTTDATFIYRILGGRIDRNAEWRAQILADGHAVFSR